MPVDEASLGVRYDVERSGAPTVRSALLHLVTSIPAALMLWVLGIVSAVLWLIAVLTILLDRTVPASIYDFQRGVLRAFGNLLAHHASLVDGAAPLRFDTGPEAGAPPSDRDQPHALAQ